MKNNWDHPTLLEFSDWLKDKPKAQASMNMSPAELKTDVSNPLANVTRTKTGTKIFASTTSSHIPSIRDEADNRPISCIVCKAKHPYWRCPVFREKTATQRRKLVADHKICYSYLNGQYSFRKCRQPIKCLKQECPHTHNTLLHDSERSFP